MEPNLTTPQLR